MATKQSRATRNITTRSITLLDSRGKPRIFLDGGDESGFASISLFSQDGGSIHISTQPDGTLVLSLERKQCYAALTLNHVGDSELTFSDRKGHLGAKLGAGFEPGKHQLLLFKDGQISRLTSKKRKK